MSMQSSIQTVGPCVAEALAVAVKELKTSEEARTKANSSAEAAARQADKLTQKLANMPKVCYCCICFAPTVGCDLHSHQPKTADVTAFKRMCPLKPRASLLW